MASAEVRADPVELTRLADAMLSASQAVADGWRGAQGPLAIPAEAFGDSSGAAGLATAHEASADDADVANGRLVAVLEGDTDRLYRVAFAYKQADDDAARRMAQQHAHGRNIPT
jgi:hypothetical protein